MNEANLILIGFGVIGKGVGKWRKMKKGKERKKNKIGCGTNDKRTNAYASKKRKGD